MITVNPSMERDFLQRRNPKERRKTKRGKREVAITTFDY
jgi:hypothetical protein